MLQKLTKLTNRKFYNKWLYKITLRCEGCDVLRLQPLSEIIEFCNQDSFDTTSYFPSWRRAFNNKEILKKISGLLIAYPSNLYNLRIERSLVDIYTNDKDMYDKISTECIAFLRHRFEPNSENIDILNNDTNCITVKKLPKNRYNYRVYLLPHKMNHDKDAKLNLLSWMKKQSPKITCTSSIEKWFYETEWNWDRRYVLVEDEATLLMLKLRNSEIVGRVYKFIICDK